MKVKQYQPDKEVAATDITMNRDEAIKLIHGNREILLKKKDPSLNRIYYFLSRDYYRPAVLVDYYREAYHCDIQNVRITFDRYVRASTVDLDLFSKDVNMVPVFDRDVIILEVKYQKFLPGYIRDILASCNGIRSAISKYCLSRVF